MKTTLEKVRIVEYHEGLANGIAKMWNESRDNWGGDASVMTEQDVIEKEGNSTNLHLYLAMIGEEVVGYCGLSRYSEDQGALYIPLLNVHPDYHGLKIGKQLVLKALDRTIELKWPRLDLFTWPGNTKAVPLYKKCGFFWEDRDDTTHLMNFIPSVLQIDCLKPFFDKHDWYRTSQRVIEVKPDGNKDGDHTYYEYRWEAGDEYVRVQFERTGRGIRLIETQDLLVEMKLPEFKLLEREEHAVSYRIVNKTMEPAHVSIKGLSTENVKHTFTAETTVSKEWIGEYHAVLTLPTREPSPWKTHPVVTADVEVDGKLFPLKMGVYPKQAGKLHLRTAKKDWRPNQKALLYLDIESQLEDDATWTIKLPPSDVVKWGQTEVKAELAGKSRFSVPVKAELLKNGFYSEDVLISVKKKNGVCFEFESKLSLAFPGLGARFGGENEASWKAYNGPYFVEIEKRNHIVKIGSVHSKQDPMTLFPPQLGKPFSEEFSKKEASFVEYIETPEAFVVKTTLESDSFESVILNTYLKIYGSGIVEIKHEIVNKSHEMKEQLYLIQPLPIQLKQMAIPQKEGVVVGDEAIVPFMDYIRDKEISERWLFTSAANGETRGLAWPEHALGRKNSWHFAIEYKTDCVPSEGEICLGPIQIGLNASPTWKEWRAFVLGDDASPMDECPLYSFEASEGGLTSQASEKVHYSFRSMLTPHLEGKLTVEGEDGSVEQEVTKKDELTEVHVDVVHNTPGVQRLHGKFRSRGQLASYETVALVTGDKEIEITEHDGNWTVDNGVLSFKASAGYYPGFYSLIYKDKEFLHHQYPEPGPKAWWNPWGGGIRYTFMSVSPYSMLKEPTSVEGVTKQDEHGNSWRGLMVTTVFKEHETMKGITLRQYALTLPEVPVMLFYCEIEQDSGRAFMNETVDLEAFFKPGEELSSSYLNLPTEGKFDTYYGGVEEFMLSDSPFLHVGSDDRKEKALLVHPDDVKMTEAYINQEVLVAASSTKWTAASGERIKLKPTVMVLGEEDVSACYKQLRKVSFM
ncbi:GNAT family N-acetyltransferase [Rossellomorea aquimaris]|uniref:GNAT family N-acetyltransferase n=1 Tax=Rossellomorea aquimaris TaxID=189382 RepID=UPI001CD4DC2E|nr:GNAT family N-acetyltransferase [Rossellomorea aquimaris]MCA1055695.1 GNAT family N-acetyltransferase [Rossellomorea aquimaris]